MRVTEPGNGRIEVGFREWFPGGAQNTTYVEVRSHSTVELAQMNYFTGSLLKILSTDRAIVANVVPLWPSHCQILPVCIVGKVVLRSDPVEYRHTSRTSHAYC